MIGRAKRRAVQICNLYSQTTSIDEAARMFRGLGMPLVFPDGIANLEPKEIGITDWAPIVRWSPKGDKFELVVRRWSWAGNHGQPVYNFRSEGREFKSGRCLIIADGFFEFTAPSAPGAKRKDRWLFTSSDGGMLGIAGLVRTLDGAGEAFTMLTTAPGPDVASYHGRQIVVLQRSSWRSWLDYSRSSADLLQTAPAGSLKVEEAPR